MARRNPPIDKPPKGTFKKVLPLTKAEQKLFWSLNKVCKNRYHLFPKMRLCDIITHTHRHDSFRIRSKHVDFMLYDKKDFSPVCAIELDGFHHQFKENHEHDLVKDYFLNTAGIPIVRMPIESFFHPEEVEVLIQNATITITEYPIGAKTEEEKQDDEAVEVLIEETASIRTPSEKSRKKQGLLLTILKALLGIKG